MPWWAIAYLVILTIVVLISVVKDYLDKKSFAYMVGEFISGALAFIFILGHWQQQLASMMSWMVVPLLLYAIVRDQYALSRMKQSNYPDLTEQENRDMDRYSKIFAMIFISPSYVAGGLLAWRLIDF